MTAYAMHNNGDREIQCQESRNTCANNNMCFTNGTGVVNGTQGRRHIGMRNEMMLS